MRDEGEGGIGGGVDGRLMISTGILFLDPVLRRHPYSKSVNEEREDLGESGKDGEEVKVEARGEDSPDSGSEASSLGVGDRGVSGREGIIAEAEAEA